jgi:2,4-dienoyl-CoA reductase-like NADH-dependent reductase (Old Yellow Enzyme family)
MSSILFSPFKHEKLASKNRIVMAPMTQESSINNVPGETQIQHYAQRARNGVGLIITEGSCIAHPGANGHKNVPFLYGEAALSGWKRVIAEVQQAGAKIIPQLWHVGGVRRASMEPSPGVPAYSPSGLMAPGRHNGLSMTFSDIDEVINAYVQAAVDAKNIGFDGIELHGAHGYLIDQFLWEATNQRSDEFGGNIINRTRFAKMIVSNIRQAVGNDFAICFRWSQWKIQDFNARLFNDESELAIFLQEMVNAGVDIFHCSTRRFWEPGFKNSPLTLAGWTKKLSGCPTIAVGGVGMGNDFLTGGNQMSHDDILSHLADSIENEEFDLFAVGRALLNNPAWVNNIRMSNGLLQGA